MEDLELNLKWVDVTNKNHMSPDPGFQFGEHDWDASRSQEDQNPIWYDRHSTPGVTATFTLSTPMPRAAIRIWAVGSDGVTLEDEPASVDGTTVTYENNSSFSSPFLNTVLDDPGFTLTWYAQVGAHQRHHRLIHERALPLLIFVKNYADTPN